MGEDKVVKSDSVVILNGMTSYDSTGNHLTYSWRNYDIDLSGSVVTFTAPNVEKDTETSFELIVYTRKETVFDHMQILINP